MDEAKTCYDGGTCRNEYVVESQAARITALERALTEAREALKDAIADALDTRGQASLGLLITYASLNKMRNGRDRIDAALGGK